MAVVADDTVNHLGYPVQKPVQCKEQTQVRLRNAQLAFHYRHGHAQVLAYQTKSGVAEYGRYQYTQLPRPMQCLDLDRAALSPTEWPGRA